MNANDTTFSFSTKNIDDLVATINNDLTSLEEWPRGNKLSLNVVKTQTMMIGSKQKLRRCNHSEDFDVSIRINAVDIQWASNTKYLGIQIDNNLAWDDQIKAIKFKVSKSCRFAQVY